MFTLPVAHIEKLATNRKMLIDQVLGNLMVESGEVVIRDLATLHDLSEKLVLPIYSLLGDDNSDLSDGVKISRRDEGYSREAQRHGQLYYTYQHLATSRRAPELMALRVTVHCNEEQASVLNSGHESKELVFITKGRVRMHWQSTAGLRQADLAVGDSAFLEPLVPHSFMSLDKEPAELLAFNY